MILLFYVILFLSLAVYAISVILFFIFAFDSLTRGHDLPTSKRAALALIGVIKEHKPDAKNFYDLGCSRGTLSLAIKKALPGIGVYGVDNSAVRIFFAKFKNKILEREVNFQKQDIFKTDLGSADIIYTYLWYDLMPILEKKLQKELKQGAVVITNTSRFQDWQPKEKVVTHHKVSKIPNFETLFVYIKE